MAIIRPFRGVRYNPAVVGDLQQVVSPPYDVISPEQQTLLHLRSPYNAVHLDLNRDPDRYAVAAKTFSRWLEQEVLIQEPEPALYFSTQEFTLQDGIRRRRAGVLAALRLEDFSSGKIRPHERTFESAKADRLALVKACQAHFSSVFCLYSCPGWSLDRTVAPALTEPPLIDVHDDGGTRHKLWRVTEPTIIAEVASRLEHETLIIADGHHRYETALRYRNERAAQGKSTGEEPFQFVLAYLTNAQDEGLVILPTHRLLRDVTLPKAEHLRMVLQREFRLSAFALHDTGAFFAALRASGAERRIGCAFAGATYYWLLSFDDRITQGLPLSAPLRALDVTVLHNVVLQRVLGLPLDVQKQKLTYTIDEEEALRQIADHRSQAAFFLNPTTFQQIANVCQHGETMPQKSTYFFPKLLTGMVFYKL
ncbi:MAG TPA: DUF1015 domain-containing protein [Methylomirabilota bacterium]|jgi:uncharacterized protein (DUF1015 family)|nr:DUF1015 domain-containing protein [Methylomirabilota bacterium]